MIKKLKEKLEVAATVIAVVAIFPFWWNYMEKTAWRKK
jgi:hypothetical protein